VLASPGIVPHSLQELCGAPFADWLLGKALLPVFITSSLDVISAREYTSLSNTNKVTFNQGDCIISGCAGLIVCL
jgi:hypothetical protein